MNNKNGWSVTEMVFLMFILFCFFLVAIFFIIKLYSSFDKEPVSNENYINEVD